METHLIYKEAKFKSNSIAKVFTDGSYNHEQGKGTYGCILINPITGTIIKKNGKAEDAIGKINPRICEMHGILNGIKLAIKHGFKDIILYTDNQDCVRIAMDYKCYVSEREWFREQLLELDKECSITLVNTSRRNPGTKQAHKLCQKAYQVN